MDGKHFIKIKIGFQGDFLSAWLVHELKIRTFHRAIYWFAQMFPLRLGAPRCSCYGTVVSNQPSTCPAGVLPLPCLPSSGPVHNLFKYLVHSVLEKQAIIREKCSLTLANRKRKRSQKWAQNGGDPVDCKNYLWRVLNNQKLQFVFSICSQGKVIWFISVKCWKDESQSNKSHFSNCLYTYGKE